MQDLSKSCAACCVQMNAATEYGIGEVPGRTKGYVLEFRVRGVGFKGLGLGSRVEDWMCRILKLRIKGAWG